MFEFTTLISSSVKLGRTLPAPRADVNSTERMQMKAAYRHKVGHKVRYPLEESSQLEAFAVLFV